jgi:serine protease inhibitor
VSRPSAATFDLLERLSGDVVACPYGLARALDVVRQGATGETRAKLDALLGDPPPEVPGIISAQAAWLGSGYSAGPKLTLETGPLDLDRINAWSNEKTRGMVPRILEEIDEDEIAVITDAEYLEAKWQHPFQVTRPKPFEGAGDVPMMYVDGHFEHDDGAVRLPYREGDLRFVAMLGEWRPIEWREGYGTVELPRFTTASTLDIARALGLSFEAGRDLDELIDGPGEKWLNRVVQRARVDVDEEGTRAAATTAGIMAGVAYREPTFHIVFDRPFTWAVEHAPTGTLLFVGRVTNPTERSE